MSKTVPDIDTDGIGFDTGETTGSRHDWEQVTARSGRKQVKFNRSIDVDGVVTITTDCEPPDMMLLNRKGDIGYWSGDIWRKHPDRRFWCADIAVNMLREGLVATGYDDSGEGLRAVMSSATSRSERYRSPGRHTLTSIVAKLRALRLLQSMTNGSKQWRTALGGRRIPGDVVQLTYSCFDAALAVYKILPQPPWDDDVPWGAQAVAGHATSKQGDDVFVGEHNDLLWRALTETQHGGRLHGRSPLKQAVYTSSRSVDRNDLIVAAALYDTTAAQQITTELFIGVQDWDSLVHRRKAQKNARDIFNNALNPADGECRWTPTQQHRIRGFVDMIDCLEP